MIGQFGGRLDAALAGHADVEEQHVRPQGQRLPHGRAAVAHHGHHLHLWPCAGQVLLQGGGQQRFIFGNQGARDGLCHGVTADFKGKVTVAPVPLG